MGTTDDRIDAYIDRAAPFSRPILKDLRRIVRASSPHIDETIKWGMPFFTYEGAPLCFMASFTKHCSFGFWKGSLLADKTKAREAMGSFGRITARSDLPPATKLKALVRNAMKLQDEGIKAPNKHPTKAPPRMPAFFAESLRDNARANAAFKAFTPGKRREYVEWLADAKTDATRKKRLSTALEWIADGKPLNWKYMPKPTAKRQANALSRTSASR